MWKVHPKVHPNTQLIPSSLLIWEKLYLLIRPALTATTNPVSDPMFSASPTYHPHYIYLCILLFLYFYVTHCQSPPAMSILRGQRTCFCSTKYPKQWIAHKRYSFVFYFNKWENSFTLCYTLTNAWDGDATCRTESSGSILHIDVAQPQPQPISTYLHVHMLASFYGWNLDSL